MTVGERIRSLRLERGFTQKQVANSCGIADSAIRKYESGKVTPKYEMLQRIATALGVHPGELMGLKDYGDNIWGPEGLTSNDLEDVRQRALLISEDQKLLKHLKERMAKKEHVTGKLELLNDDGLDIAVQTIDAIVGNPRLSTYPDSPPYFKPSPTASQSPPAPQESQNHYYHYYYYPSSRQEAPQSTLSSTEGKDTTAAQDAPEGPQEGE